jgi:hypothetical protein
MSQQAWDAAYAAVVEGEPSDSRGLHFAGNVFPPGSGGVSNVELQP